jgi:hypothetical protein
MFGTFVEEGEKCVYGTLAPLDSWDPLWANLEVYADLARKSWRSPRWRDKFAVWLMPPGWQPAMATGSHWRKSPFDVASVRRFDPPMSRGTRGFAAAHFTIALLASVPFLWFSDTLAFASLALGSGAIVALLWITGALMQGRLSVRAALGIDLLLALATAIAVANAA